jgi:hypothetical protein
VGTDSRTNERYEYVTDVTSYSGDARKESIERELGGVFQFQPNRQSHVFGAKWCVLLALLG